MIELKISKSLDEVGPVLDELSKRQIASAVRRAANRAIITARKLAAEAFNAIYNLKASEVKDRLLIRQAEGFTGLIGDVSASLTITPIPVPLYLYRARQTKKGVVVNVAGASKVVNHAFIATMASGHTGVYVRDPNKRQRKIWVKDWTKARGGYYKTLPIKELYGISPYQFFKAKSNFTDLEKEVRTSFESNLTHELEYAVSEAEKKAKTK